MSVLLLAGLLAGLLTMPGTAGAQQSSGLLTHPVTLTYPVTTCSSLAISTTRPLPGEKVLITGTNFRADRPVRLVLDTGLTLGTTTTGPGGAFTASVGIPQDLHGHHLIFAAGGAVRGRSCPVDPSLAFDVAGDNVGRHGGDHPGSSNGSSDGSSSGSLSFTGVDVLGLLAVALVLVLAGVALLGRQAGPHRQRRAMAGAVGTHRQRTRP